MKVLHFGAGNIGKGLVGEVLYKSGFKIVFVDVNQLIINIINRKNSYRIKFFGNEKRSKIIKRVKAIHISSKKKLFFCSSNIDLITTAVCPVNLKKIAKVIAGIVIFRKKNNIKKIINIIACENMAFSSSFFKKEILKKIPNDISTYFLKYTNFIDCVVDRIVVEKTEKGSVIPAVITEQFYEWVIDKIQAKKGNFYVKGIKYTDNMKSYIQRKLFTLNTGHAILAYIGLLYGYTTVQKAILNSKVYKITKKAIIESGRFLCKEFAFDKKKYKKYLKTILLRFKNPNLQDSLLRIGRDPIRKLSFTDRLITPILKTEQYGLPNTNLIKGVAAAFFYKNIRDKESIFIKDKIKKNGFLKTLLKITNLYDYPEITKKIFYYYKYFKKYVKKAKK